MLGRAGLFFTLTAFGLGCAGGLDSEHPAMDFQSKLDRYATFRLEADLSTLTESERAMLPLLIEAAQVMDRLFWRQAWGPREQALALADDPTAKRYIEINYGPWDRLDGNAPFIPGVGPKPPGARFYPEDITKEEFEAAALKEGGEALRDLYTLVRREGDHLVAVPYSRAFREELTRAADKLREAARLADDAGLKRYLELRAEALASDDYRPSDLAWMEMKTNTLDIVIGPIETYEDRLFGYKAAFEAYVLVKDKAWSARLSRYAAMLDDLQRGLPVPDAYKSESPGSDSEINAYEAIYYAGDCNAGAKTIAINLPNDEAVQLAKGARRLQLKNAMRAKFENILEPIADRLIAADQRRHVTFDAFFANTMFHEVAHGLGVKNTINGRGSVREALRDKAAALEEGKADILGLYLVSKLRQRGEFDDSELMDNYVTFLAGIFRSVRFGASSAHGVANLLRFNFFERQGAFTRDEASGRYRIEPEAMGRAVAALSEKILRLQGDGDYAGAERFIAEDGSIRAVLQGDLERLESAAIPVDIVFEQGL